jgi:hypothetical protein
MHLSVNTESVPKEHVSVTCSCAIRKWTMGKFLSHLRVFVASQPVNLIQLCYRIGYDSWNFMVGRLHACARPGMCKISVSFHHCDQAKGLIAFVRWSMHFTRANTKAILTFVHSGFWSRHLLFSLFNSHSNLAPGFKNQWSYTSTPLYDFLVCTGAALLSKPFVFPNNINRLMFLMELQCVFCEVNINFYKVIILLLVVIRAPRPRLRLHCSH